VTHFVVMKQGALDSTATDWPVFMSRCCWASAWFVFCCYLCPLFLFDVRRVFGLWSFVACVCTTNFDVLLTVQHLSIILAIDQLNAQIFVL